MTGRRLLLWLGAGFLAVAATGGIWLWQLFAWADTPFASDAFRAQLRPGQSLAGFAGELHAAEHLQDERRLVLLGRLTGADVHLQAGEYDIARGATPRELLELLASGAVVTYAFRVAEGVRAVDVLRALRAESSLTHELAATDAQALHAELGLATPFAEGMFFPDTYQYRRGDSDRALLERAHRAMLEELGLAWAERAAGLGVATPEEAVILASIIEKETGLATDRRQISQVFHKRLHERMLLQTDPSVIYALGDEFDGNLTRAHLRIDSPFNTYRYRGLPPTPIALPSAASLRAAVQPATGDFLYFVARGDGSSEFSRTLAEHNQAVRTYQLKGGRG